MGSSNFVTIDKMDLVVYGQVQFSFSMGGVSGYDLAHVCTASSFRRVTAVEDEIGTVSAACEARAKKLADLGNAMGAVQYTMSYIDGKMDNEEIDSHGLGSIYNTLAYYNVPDAGYALNNPIVISNLRTLFENLKHEIDLENNDLQRTTATLQNVMGKRDSAFSTLSKITEKLDNTVKATIQNMGN